MTDFATGGILGAEAPPHGENVVRIPNTDGILCARISDHLNASSERACVLENAVADRADPYVARLPSTFFYGSEVYHCVLDTSGGREAIGRVVKAAKSIPQFVGVLTVWPGDLSRTDIDDVSLEQLRSLARSATLAFAGAYDGESYVLATT
jgi:hypothetical protein